MYVYLCCTKAETKIIRIQPYTLNNKIRLATNTEGLYCIFDFHSTKPIMSIYEYSVKICTIKFDYIVSVLIQLYTKLFLSELRSRIQFQWFANRNFYEKINSWYTATKKPHRCIEFDGTMNHVHHRQD